MRIKVYNDLEQLMVDYKTHPLYVYPVTCRKCKSRIKYAHGLFSCGCQHFILKFKFGINVKPNLEVKE